MTLLLRVSSPETRRRWLLPRAAFARRARPGPPGRRVDHLRGVMWATHFSPLFDASLEDPLVHDLEHVLFLTGGAAVLVAGGRARPGAVADEPPGPDRLRVHADDPEHVPRGRDPQCHDGPLSRTTRRSSGRGGSTALEDQRLAAGIMWIAGDPIFLTAIMAVVAGWMRAETRDEARADRRADDELAQIRIRERRLAERLARGARGQTRAREAPRPAAGRQPSGGTGREVLAIALRVDIPAADHRDDRAVAGPRPSSPAWNAIAAIPSAPDGSTTSRLRSAASRTPAAISASERSRSNPAAPAGARTSGARAPASASRRRSSATPLGRPRHDLARSSESRASAASSGSTPMTRAPGRRLLMAVATPLANPPPPIGTRTTATSGRSSAISSPTVPWPAMIRSSSNGGMIASPRSRGDRLGDPLSLVAGGADHDDLGAVGGHPVALDGRRVPGHDDDGGRPSRRAARATPCAWFPEE